MLGDISLAIYCWLADQEKLLDSQNVVHYQRVGAIWTKSGCLFWNIESYNRRSAIKGFRTPTLTFSLPPPSLVLWLSIQTLVHARVAFSLGRCIIRITPIWSKLTKEPPPFQSTGHGRYQRWSRWNCDFISAINYLLSAEKI